MVAKGGRLNEEEAIDLIQETLHGRALAKDDVIPFKAGKDAFVLKCEMLVSSTDVPPTMSLKHVGRKAVATAVSDFAAKGVRPMVAVLSLAIPRSFSRHDIELLAQGFRWAQDEFELPILGGDTNEGLELVIDCSAFGRGKILSRRGAKDGDVVMVSGPFGYSAAGLKILLERLDVRSSYVRRAMESVLEPQPQLKLGLALAEHKLARASIDSSDGLALSLYQLAEACNLGIRITSLPYDGGVTELARLLNVRLEELVLYAGEEFHLVLAVPPAKVKDTHRVAENVGVELIPIGRFDKTVTDVLGVDGHVMERRGWIHLA